MPVVPINTERTVHPAAVGIALPRTGQHTTPNRPVSTKKAGVSPVAAGGLEVKIILFVNAANALAPGGKVR